MDMQDAPRFGPAAGEAPDALVVLVHGFGADGNDLIDLAALWAEAVPGALFVAPHAPEACDGIPFGRQWFPLWDRSQAQLAVGVGSAAAALGRFVAAEASRLGLAPDRVALMGFSQGAMTVLEAGLCGAVPAPACVLAYSGGLIGAESLPARIAARPPVLLVHGEADEVVPAAASRAAESALAASGVPVRAIFRPDLGHGLDEVGLAAGAEVLRGVLNAA
ncbi:prolyl oligopeptidase family serine peptidase [Roseomonas eburnea]|uniref:Prolyl oligopeptidase family serine peptidase n=1 Tax=Neoroseomonas eburnea TaxID=1346889 RepID=A0A9X9X7B4_9PROT|nr:prolyl oligopeptidase family serine peptidase [Neoroseomonas eburnea]MBR0679600.1 prolyl oligopeptidase family serine peptidase [Neoroseomonas eburnea]